MAYKKRLYSGSVDLDALAFEESLSLEGEYPNRYGAACSAALAVAGKGEAVLGSEMRAVIVAQALAWLGDDLENLNTAIASGEMEPAAARARLEHWKQDSDLISVREAEALEVLEADQRAACEALWRAVDELQANAELALEERLRRNSLLLPIDLVGEYVRHPEENDWHRGSLSLTGEDTVTWTNKAGRSWTLRLDLANGLLRAGDDDPYYDESSPGSTDVTIVYRDLARGARPEVEALRIRNEDYRREPGPPPR